MVIYNNKHMLENYMQIAAETVWKQKMKLKECYVQWYPSWK